MKKRTKNIPIIRDVVDTETGEISQVPDNLRLVSFDLGNWFKLMLIEEEVSLPVLESLGKPFMVFYVLLMRTNWKDCSVSVDSMCKEHITRVTKLKYGMTLKYITGFCQGKLIKKIAGTSYMINPRYFYIGDKVVQQTLIQKYNSYGNKF